jgi:negative regulator of replication initiation
MSEKEKKKVVETRPKWKIKNNNSKKKKKKVERISSPH